MLLIVTLVALLGKPSQCSAQSGKSTELAQLFQHGQEALNQGHLVHVAADAVSSRTELNWKLGLERMRDAGAVISSTEMMIYELLGKSGSPEFREMLKHLR